MNKKAAGLWSVAVIFLLGATGCETFKGMKQDVENTKEHAVSIPVKVNQMDHWVRENMW